jgi:hypothetical protein
MNTSWRYLKVNSNASEIVYKTGQHYCHPWEIIFFHSFAKAFWGEGVVDWENDREQNYEPYSGEGCTAEYEGKRWQYHLQQMILEENPIKYLEKFI